MELKDLVIKATRITGNYIKNGWILNASTMGGSQGEMLKVDLTKDFEGGPATVRISITKSYIYLDDYYRFTVESFDTGFDPHSSTILWNGEGTIGLDEYYGIKRDGSIYYMGTKADINKAGSRKQQRWGYKPFNYPHKKVDSKYYDLIKSIVSRFDIPGWKRFEIKDVTTWKNKAGSTNYMVVKPNGRTFQFYRTKDKILFYTND